MSNKNRNLIDLLTDALTLLKTVAVENCDELVDKDKINARAYTIIRKNRITTIGELSNANPQKILSSKNCGRKTVCDIIEYCYKKCYGDDYDCTTIYLIKQEHARFNKLKQDIYAVADNYFISKEKVYTNDFNKIQELAKSALSIIDKILLQLYDFVSEKKQPKINILKEYINFDNSTLASIGKTYSRTRECINQNCKKATKILRLVFSKLCTDIVVGEYLDELCDIFEKISNPSDLLFLLISLPCNRKKLNFILTLLFDTKFATNLLKIKWRLEEIKKDIKQTEKNTNKLKEKLNALCEKICYPSKTLMTTSSLPSTVALDKNFKFIDNVKTVFKEFSLTIDNFKYVINPDILYHKTDKTNFYPDFYIEVNGKPTLVLVIQQANMAFYYNAPRFNALHLFCKENGYGYLIIDDRFTSIYELKSMPIAKEVTENLMSILDSAGVITWKDILHLRESISLSAKTIFAFILQNKLKFSPKPFTIKRP